MGNPNASPGIGTEKIAAPRKILASVNGVLYLPNGKVVDGSESRDPLNTGDIDVLRAGLVMGKRSANGLLAPSILGVTTAAAVTADGTLTVPAAVATEVNRRIGVGGVFKLVGPRVSGEPVRERKLGVLTSVGTTITLQANSAVAEVQTSTLDALMTAGTFTMTYKGYTTAPIAFNATVAQITAALELLPSIGSGDITMQAAHEPDAELTCTWTFRNTLGDVPMLSMDISKATGPSSCTWAETTPGELVAYATPGTVETQTLTLASAGTDAGNFRVRFKDAVTALLAWNVSAADMTAALEGLATIGAGNVVATLAAQTYTVTFIGALEGPQPLLQVCQDSTMDGIVWEGGVVVARTVVGGGGAFVAGSLLMAADGSEVPVTFIDEEYGIKVTDDDGTTVLDVRMAKVLVAGLIQSSQIVNYPVDESLKRWLKDQLNSIAAGRFIFDDDYALI